MRALKRGFSLHELLISLMVMGIVFGLATHFAVRQLRVFRHVADVGGQRTQIEQITEIVRNALVNVSPSTGELLVAQDSALEIRVTTGTSVVCAAAPGEVTVPRPDEGGRSASAFLRAPEPGDRLGVLFSDSAGVTWLHLQVASTPAPGGPCAISASSAATWRITTIEPMTLPLGAALRFTRPLRLSLYRSADEQWYLGAKDWNGDPGRFNTIQPVAGPVLPYSDGPESGLRFEYRDASGQLLPPPVDGARVRSVTVVARAPTDSVRAVVRLPNAP